MSGVKFDTSEVTKWIKNQSDRDGAKRKALNVISIQGEQRLKKEASKISVSSKLYNSIRGRVDKDKALIESNAEYAEAALETGRKPGKAPPYKALEMWAQRKLGDKKLAFVVARKIAREGTQKHKRGNPKMVTSVMDFLGKDLIPKQLTKLLDAYTK